MWVDSLRLLRSVKIKHITQNVALSLIRPGLRVYPAPRVACRVSRPHLVTDRFGSQHAIRATLAPVHPRIGAGRPEKRPLAIVCFGETSRHDVNQRYGFMFSLVLLQICAVIFQT